MVVTSLDAIVRNMLLKRGYSMHWYLEFLLYAKECLAEISLDEDINTIRYKLLILNDNNALSIPDDCADVAKVSVRIGQYLHPLIEDNSLDLVPNYNSTFGINPYSQGVASQPVTNWPVIDGYVGPYWWTVNWNAFGENTGRQFGGVGQMSDTYKVNKERNEIKINENLSETEFIVEYIGDGTDADSATHITVYAAATIRRYSLWQFKENNRTYSKGEAISEQQGYLNERQILRARNSDLTVDKFKRAVQQNTRGIKY